MKTVVYSHLVKYVWLKMCVAIKHVHVIHKIQVFIKQLHFFIFTLLANNSSSMEDIYE